MSEHYVIANPNNGEPLTMLAEYQGTDSPHKTFATRQQAQQYAESIGLTEGAYIIIPKEG